MGRNRVPINNCELMRDFLMEVVAQDGCDWDRVISRPGYYLRLEKRGFAPLVIETLDDNQISVSQSTRLNDHVLYQPEVVFYCKAPVFVPTYLTIDPLIELDFGTVYTHGLTTVGYTDTVNRAVVFANQWAMKLRENGFHQMRRDVVEPSHLPADSHGFHLLLPQVSMS
jgi:hypothetical protein